MTRKRLIWLLFPSLWIITILALAAVTIYISQSFHKFHLDRVASDLETRALIVRNSLRPNDFGTGGLISDYFCAGLCNNTSTRLTIVDSAGTVLCDSEEDSGKMENHGGRPEISAALAGRTGIAVRYSQTLGAELIYVAIPVLKDSVIIGAIRASESIASVQAALIDVYRKVALGGIMVMIMITAASIYTSRQIIKPLANMRLIAQGYADGDLNLRMPDHRSAEIGELADSMNWMASQLDNRIKAVIRQRNEEQAVLSSMVEGVLAVDPDEKIIRLNSAAIRMLGVEEDSYTGKYIHEIVRNAQVQGFVKRILEEKRAVEPEIVMIRKGNIFLQANGTVLKGADGAGRGAVVVLNDITRLHQLENIRRDFVANVSHELKTPITSIKGFVETLQEGAINDPEKAAKFLDIISKQTDRLNSIIEDLLSLSRIEEQEEKSAIELAEQDLKPVLISSIQTCEPYRAVKAITIDLECEDDIKARINPDLFQQAIVNLLHNSIKYSPAGERVTVAVGKKPGKIIISVCDNGPGIAKEHQPRLFERFYRVDKERSRQLGGTGLGLAIAKHIILAHHGQVSVESEPGKGSRFIITLPE